MVHFSALTDLGAETACMTEEKDGPISIRTRLSALLDVDRKRLRLIKQVHSALVIPVSDDEDPTQREADGMVTRDPGILMAVTIADCVPIFLLDPSEGVAGLIHAGREGTRKGIASVGVGQMTSLGAIPQRIHAFIGPSAGPCCYEVSAEMAKASEEEGLVVEGRYIDLWQSNSRQLLESGVPPGQIAFSGLCTICRAGFYSYRRGFGSARNAAVFGLEKGRPPL